MFNTPVHIALIAAFACAPFVSAQDTHTSTDSTPASPSPEKRPRRVGFLPDIAGDKRTVRPESLRFSVEDAVAKSLESSRDIRAAARLIDEAQGRRESAGLMPNPELEIGGGPGLYARHTGIMQAEFRQKFPITSRLRLEERIADTDVAVAKEEVLIARRRVVGEVKTVAVRLLALREEIALVGRRREIAQKLADESRARATRGEASSNDTGFLELEAASFADELARIEAERASLLPNFRVKLGLKPDADADIAGGIPDARDEYGLPDPNACPECRKLRLLADGAQTAVELANAGRWQDISVGVFGQLEHTYGNTDPRNHQNLGYAGVKVTVPLPLWNDKSGENRSARAHRERLNEELAAEIARLDGDAQSARRELDLLTARLPDLRDKLLPAAAAQTERIRSSLTKGEAVPSDLLRALDKQAEIERRTVTLRRDIALALVRLETALSAHPSLKDPVVTPTLPE